jgi:hypothetical protein
MIYTKRERKTKTKAEEKRNASMQSIDHDEARLDEWW